LNRTGEKGIKIGTKVIKKAVLTMIGKKKSNVKGGMYGSLKGKAIARLLRGGGGHGGDAKESDVSKRRYPRKVRPYSRWKVRTGLGAATVICVSILENSNLH